MKTRIALVMLVFGPSVVARDIRIHVAGVESPTLTAWPGEVIFGFYFTIRALAVQGLLQFQTVTRSGSPRQALLLLVLAGVCSDLVLTNVLETTVHVVASYGLVALLDVATFFICLRTIDLPRRELAAVSKCIFLPRLGLHSPRQFALLRPARHGVERLMRDPYEPFGRKVPVSNRWSYSTPLGHPRARPSQCSSGSKIE